MASVPNLNEDIDGVEDNLILISEDEEDGENLPFDLNEPAGDIEDLFDLNELPREEYGQPESSHHQQPSINEDPRQQDHHQPKRRKFSSDHKMQILAWLLSRAKEGELVHGTINSAAQEFEVSRRCISNLWKKAKEQRNANQRYTFTTNFYNSGRKRIQVPPDHITSLNMGERSCIRDLASNLNLSKSTVHRMIKRKIIKPHTNALHPSLNDANKKTRMEWILNLLQGDTVETKRQYHQMFNFVHLDEEWFNLTKKAHRVYLAQQEKGKYRATSSSKFIPKVMFTTVVARPRFKTEGHCTFDGKIGIFSFTYQEAAKRSSKNREKGTIVTKMVESVNQKVTKDMLINHIIPAIKAKWPVEDT